MEKIIFFRCRLLHRFCNMARGGIGRKHQSAQTVDIHVKTLAAPRTVIVASGQRHHVMTAKKLYHALIRLI